jgi:hypothetical protein
MERTWFTINNLKKHISDLWNSLLYFLFCIAVKLENSCTKRWDMMLTDLHYASALLSPYLKDVLEI